jgi:curli biogenesis system outer membrane secretion channel CsgG
VQNKALPDMTMLHSHFEKKTNTFNVEKKFQIGELGREAELSGADTVIPGSLHANSHTANEMSLCLF